MTLTDKQREAINFIKGFRREIVKVMSDCEPWEPREVCKALGLDPDDDERRKRLADDIRKMAQRTGVFEKAHSRYNGRGLVQFWRLRPEGLDAIAKARELKNERIRETASLPPSERVRRAEEAEAAKKIGARVIKFSQFPEPGLFVYKPAPALRGVIPSNGCAATERI